MQMIAYAWEFVVNIIESSFLIVFMDDKMLINKRFKPSTSWILKILFIIIDSIRTDIFNYCHISYELNYLFSFFCFIAFTSYFYDAKFSSKLFFSSIYLAILLASDTIASIVPHTFFNVSIETTSVGGSLRIAFTLLYLVCIAGFVYISHFLKWSVFTMSPIETVVYILVCTIGFFFGQFSVSIAVDSYSLFENIQFTNKLILVSSTYSILFLILLSYTYQLNRSKAQNKKLNDEKQQLLLEEADYNNLISSTESLRKLKHDMKHHLSTIQLLAQQGNSDELNTYITKYIGSLNEIHKFVNTGNNAIDCILSTSISDAENKGIQVNYSLSVPDTFILDPILTSSLLGNLWTNAITACERLLHGQDLPSSPFINFYVKPIEKMLLISIENSYDGTILKKTNGEYASTKDNKNGGIGIKRIKEIVEQNDGIIEITDNNYIFCVHIMFPLMEKISNENSNT